MKEYIKIIFKKEGESCDECGQMGKLKVYKVANAGDCFDSDRLIALCEQCDWKDDVEEAGGIGN